MILIASRALTSCSRFYKLNKFYYYYYYAQFSTLLHQPKQTIRSVENTRLCTSLAKPNSLLGRTLLTKPGNTPYVKVSFYCMFGHFAYKTRYIIRGMNPVLYFVGEPNTKLCWRNYAPLFWQTRRFTLLAIQALYLMNIKKNRKYSHILLHFS